MRYNYCDNYFNKKVITETNIFKITLAQRCLLTNNV